LRDLLIILFLLSGLLDLWELELVRRWVGHVAPIQSVPHLSDCLAVVVALSTNPGFHLLRRTTVVHLDHFIAELLYRAKL
jgi:hypothetical protein